MTNRNRTNGGTEDGTDEGGTSVDVNTFVGFHRPTCRGQLDSYNGIRADRPDKLIRSRVPVSAPRRRTPSVRKARSALGCGIPPADRRGQLDSQHAGFAPIGQASWSGHESPPVRPRRRTPWVLEDRWSHREKWPPNLTTNAKRADMPVGLGTRQSTADNCRQPQEQRPSVENHVGQIYCRYI